jgi:hypothetical protein
MGASEGKTGKPVASEREGGLSELSEDALGFGVAELRTARDLLIRPRAVLDAYDQHGSTGGGRYTRPLKFYLALCGLSLAISFLFGGMETFFNQTPPELLDRAKGIATASGKSLDAFIADADGWSSLLITPIYILFSTATVVPLISLWSRSGWRRSFRAGFGYLSAWTLPLMAATPLVFVREYAELSMVLTVVVAVVTLLRVGPGRWWTTAWGGVAKTVVFTVVLLVMTALASFTAVALSLVGARFGP